MATQTAQTTPQELSTDAQFALDYVGAMGPDSPLGDETEVLKIADSLERVEERLMVLDGLYSVAKDRTAVARAIEAAEDAKYGNGLIEVASLAELSKATDRVLKGRNAAVVVRANTWGDQVHQVGDEVVGLLAPIGKLERVGTEKFPKPSMAAGSSRLHLDNFIYDRERKTGFRFTLSAAQVETGSALFIGGVASKRNGARNIQPKQEGQVHPYEQALLRLEGDPKVQHLYATAEQGRPKLHTEFDAKEGTHITSVVLKPGDTVLWAQGGPGSEAAAWHAFRQIGDEARTSTSYHYVMQDV